MDKLETVSTDALREALVEASSAKATKRLMIALAYADGASVETLAARYGIPRATVYAWLDRFEHRPIPEATADEPRPGRPPKLDESQRTHLSDDLANPPVEFDYDASAWSPELVRSHVERTYGVTYSLGHVRRLLREHTPGE